MAKFVEFDIIYASGEAGVNYEALGLPEPDDDEGRIDKAIIDVTQITGIYKSCKKAGDTFTDTNINLMDGTLVTVRASYEDVIGYLTVLQDIEIFKYAK